MSVLQALDRYYERMAARGEADEPGWSRESISFALVLSVTGEIVDVIDLRELKGKKLLPRKLSVPSAGKRASGILPNFFWDKTAYVFARSIEDKPRQVEEHAAFVELHLQKLTGVDDDAARAIISFLNAWNPTRFDTAPLSQEQLNANFVFRLQGDTCFVHERPTMRALVSAFASGGNAKAMCLVTGVTGEIARLHPTIKGVDGAQSSGASLVSFNLDAFTSYGQDQGSNAPTSAIAAFRYGTALNRMLDRGSRNRLSRTIGDATMVFWADASSVETAKVDDAESLVASWFEIPSAQDDEVPDHDAEEAAKIHDALKRIASASNPGSDSPVTSGVRFYVLGLAPNASRLSVRWWFDGDFGVFAGRLVDHDEDIAIAPTPWRKQPSLSYLLMRTTALAEKADNVPPMLAGEVMRAIIAGGRYPRHLLSAALMRLRAGDSGDGGWHAAVIRGVLARDHRLGLTPEETPVALDRENKNPAYQLGRLFAALEAAQRQALGKTNATIRDRYYGAASSTPANVFPLLIRGAQNHLGKLRKGGKGAWIEHEIEEIGGRLPPQLPRSLRLEAQGRFAIGYYHQRQAQFAGRPKDSDHDDIEENEDHE